MLLFTKQDTIDILHDARVGRSIAQKSNNTKLYNAFHRVVVEFTNRLSNKQYN